MKFKLIDVGRTSATFELDNEAIYYAPCEFEVKLNDETVLKENHNVFSLFGLTPGSEYRASIDQDEVKFTTLPSAMDLNIQDFLNPYSEDDNMAFASAIAVLKPGGRLIVPRGDYHITTIFLKSNMTLELQKGAIVIGSIKKETYGYMPGEISDSEGNIIQLSTWEGCPFSGLTSVIFAYNAENVRIEGEGTIDGQGQLSEFWINHKQIPYARPRLVFFNNCKHVTMVGITVQNSPAWTIHPYFTDDFSALNVTVVNPKISPNTDGLDPECCDGVRILGTSFSVGDDCIAMKSGKIYVGAKYKKPTCHVQIRNCLMKDGHGAIVLGSEVGAGIKDVTLERCIFSHTDRGLRIKTRRGRGKDSVIDGIHFKNIIMDNVLTPLVINMFYFCDPDGHTEYVQNREKLPVDDKTPFLGSFVFENIQARGAEYAIGWFSGLPEQPIGSIKIINSSFSVSKDADEGFPAMTDNIDKVSKRGMIFDNVECVELDNVLMAGCEGEEVTLKSVASFKRK